MYSKVKNIAMGVPLLNKVILFLYRMKIANSFLADFLRKYLKFLFKNKEITNFTYELHPLNKKYLVQFVSVSTGVDFDEIVKFMHEIENNKSIQNHICDSYRENHNGLTSNESMSFARRVGWYCFVRATKPKIVCETGVDKGLGSIVLIEALIKNHKEGFHGLYKGFDINKKAGYLLTGRYAEYGEIIYGDSLHTLKSFDKEIDLFINDSDHSSVHEGKEYEIIQGKLSSEAIVLGDNSHCNDELFNFSKKYKRKFVFFKEDPLSHIYPGAGIGISYI